MQANVYFFFSREKLLEFWPKYLILSLADFDLAHLAEPPLLPGRRPKNLALGQESVAPRRPPTTRLSQACVSRRMQDQRLASRPLRVKGGARSAAPKTLAHFFLTLLSPHPTAAIGEREGNGAGDAARAGGGGGAAEHYSPEVHAAVASAQLRRASLVGALRPNPCARGIHRIRSGDGEGGHITPVVGLPAALGSRGRPARRRCGGDGGAA